MFYTLKIKAAFLLLPPPPLPDAFILKISRTQIICTVLGRLETPECTASGENKFTELPVSTTVTRGSRRLVVHPNCHQLGTAAFEMRGRCPGPARPPVRVPGGTRGGSAA